VPTHLFRNLQLLDPRFDEPRGGYEVLAEDGFIKEVSERPIAAANAQRIDCGGRTLAGSHRLSRACVSQRGQRFAAGTRAGLAAGRSRCAADAGHAEPRFHDGARYGRRRLGNQQSREFLLRAEVLRPMEIIRSATTIGAEIIRMPGKLGIIEPGAFADLLVVDGDPSRDLDLFQDQGAHLSAIMKGGRFHKNRLH
jgi:imidazolonepropionase-like amidohydrolase